MGTPTPTPIALPSSLRPLTAGRDAQDDPKRVAELAHQFEALFIGQMLRQMRQSMTMFGEEEQDNTSQPFSAMTEQMDTELAGKLSEGGGFGIADVIINAFGRQQRDAGVAPPASGAPAAVSLSPVQAPVPLTDSQPLMPLDAALKSRLQTAPAVPMPASHVTSSFGWRQDPLTGQVKFHKGVDLRAAYGQSVTAVAGGRVVQAGPQGGYGLSVVVEHGSGIRTRYAHLSELSVQQGDVVNQGTQVGKAGQSGRSTGPHLHFEILADGRPVDPVQAADRFRILGELKPVQAVADSPIGGPPTQAAAEE